LPGSITPLPCPTGTTFDAIDCRFAALLDDVTGAPDLGVLHDKLRTLVADAKTRFEGIPTAGNKRKAKALGKAAARKLVGFSHRVTSHAGRKAIASETTRSRLTGQADGIRGDVLAYRRTL
jgi:hypothetical protein